MEKATLVHGMTSDQIIERFDRLENQIKAFEEKFAPASPIELYTRAEVAKLFKVDISTIHNWCVRKKLKPYGVGNRVYFKVQEIEAALKPI